MKLNDITKLTIDELKKRKKRLKLSTSILAGLVIIMYVFQIYNYIETKAFKFSMLLPVAFTFLIISSYKNIKRIKEEIDTRV